MIKRKLGIKYCGGCHVAYDRKKALYEIQERLGEAFISEHVKEETTYDVVLVMNGCSAQCADISRIHSKYGFVSCSNLVTVQQVVQRIIQLAEGSN